jgi:hypothetical protein
MWVLFLSIQLETVANLTSIRMMLLMFSPSYFGTFSTLCALSIDLANVRYNVTYQLPIENLRSYR